MISKVMYLARTIYAEKCDTRAFKSNEATTISPFYKIDFSALYKLPRTPNRLFRSEFPFSQSYDYNERLYAYEIAMLENSHHFAFKNNTLWVGINETVGKCMSRGHFF